MYRSGLAKNAIRFRRYKGPFSRPCSSDEPALADPLDRNVLNELIPKPSRLCLHPMTASPPPTSLIVFLTPFEWLTSSRYPTSTVCLKLLVKCTQPPDGHAAGADLKERARPRLSSTRTLSGS
jgi:hypothetical protein